MCPAGTISFATTSSLPRHPAGAHWKLSPLPPRAPAATPAPRRQAVAPRAPALSPPAAPAQIASPPPVAAKVPGAQDGAAAGRRQDQEHGGHGWRAAAACGRPDPEDRAGRCDASGRRATGTARCQAGSARTGPGTQGAGGRQQVRWLGLESVCGIVRCLAGACRLVRLAASRPGRSRRGRRVGCRGRPATQGRT